MSFIPILVLLLAAMWLLVIRPQRARQKAAQNTRDSLVPGAEVLTAGGLYGTVRFVDDDEVRSRSRRTRSSASPGARSPR